MPHIRTLRTLAALVVLTGLATPAIATARPESAVGHNAPAAAEQRTADNPRAAAQARYYASYGEVKPLTHARPHATPPDDSPPPTLVVLVAALAAMIIAASAIHLRHRRHAARPV